MTIDVKGILAEIADVLKTEIANASPVIIQSNFEYLADAEPRIGFLATGAASGKLSFKFVAEELKKEGINLKVHVMAQAQIVEAQAESAINRVVHKLLDFLLKIALNAAA